MYLHFFNSKNLRTSLDLEILVSVSPFLSRQSLSFLEWKHTLRKKNMKSRKKIVHTAPASGTGRNAVFMLRKKKKKQTKDVDTMSVSELKKYIIAKGSSLSGCISVEDLRIRAKEDPKTSLSTSLSPSNTQKILTSSPSATAKGLVGLRNIGNTCFMNSCLQCLSNISVLRESLLRVDETKNYLNPNSMTKGDLAKTLLELLRSMWTLKAHSVETSLHCGLFELRCWHVVSLQWWSSSKEATSWGDCKKCCESALSVFVVLRTSILKM